VLTRTLLLLLLLSAGSCLRRKFDVLPGFPRLVLWAWEMPENLSFLSTQATGIAFLAETITISNGGFTYRPRMQPLRAPAGTPAIAVIRIESRDNTHPAVEAVIAEILHAIPVRRIRALQIDYDALLSQRAFYRQLLRELRARLPKAVALQMTALVSWCMADDWLRDLPVAEAIPMFFRMGVEPYPLKTHLREPLCRSSIGISTDEVYDRLPEGRRVYVFHPRPWTESDYRALLRESTRWR
jgi:hypothetical protein